MNNEGAVGGQGRDDRHTWAGLVTLPPDTRDDSNRTDRGNNNNDNDNILILILPKMRITEMKMK